MEDAEQVREALAAYMAANDLKPTPWARAAGLSERTLSHFINGLTKSITPGSLGKLARNRDTTISGMLGFLPRFAAQDLPLGEPRIADVIRFADALEKIAAANRDMADEIKRLHAKVDSLETAVLDRKREP
jgi:DNA-binding Xre family transcriptional regulator